MSDRPKIDISGIPKAAVLAALWNASAPAGMGFLRAAGHADTMTVEDAEQLIASGETPDYPDFQIPGRRGTRELYFDYLHGRPLKSDISGDEFDPWGFDRDNGGDGSAQKVIDRLRETGEVTSEEQQALTRDRTIANAHDAMAAANTTSSVDESGGIPVFSLGADELGEPLEKAVDQVVERVSQS